MSVEIRDKEYKVKKRKGKLTLNLTGKRIADIDEIKNLDSLSDLQKLILRNNPITEIKGLDNLLNLQILIFGNNKITKIKGLENLKLLEKLSLKSNQIGEIENLETLKNLKTLLLEGNPCYKEFIKKFLVHRKVQRDIINQATLFYAKQPFERRKEFEAARKITIDDGEFEGMKMCEIVQKVDEYLEKKFLNEKHIYYPVNMTPLLEKLNNFMKKDDIIYSTLSEIKFVVVTSRGPAGVKINRNKWETQLLLTKEGIGYQHISASKKDLFTYVFQKWKSMGVPNSEHITISLNGKVLKIPYTNLHFEDPSDFTISLIREATFESENSFNNRKNKFTLFCRLLWLRELFKDPPLDIFEYLDLMKYLKSAKKTPIIKEIIYLID